MNFIHQKLQERIAANALRTLKSENNLIDFSSNDYLGFAKSLSVKEWVDEIAYSQKLRNGAGGSRLITGNSSFTETLEKEIARFHQAASGLIFNSGYDANVGLLSSLPQKGDTIICDELIHASLIDGARLSYAQRYTFKHHDLAHLESKIKNSQGNIFIVTESIFSMDGDHAPLKEIAALAAQYGAYLIVDEAHATGIFGKHGKGLVCELGLENQVFARVVTFGKALGCHGAIVLGNDELRSYLINFARSFIYTTALPPHSLYTIKAAYEQLKSSDYTLLIQKKIAYFKQLTSKAGIALMPSNSAIQGIIIQGNTACRQAAATLNESGFDIRPILSPTVPVGKERLRICLHTFNTDEEIEKLSEALAKI
ncbi:aminotransferase class I/II-fold pyridoxal phosphate-dependent enzyme [Pedobacter glucosidilyticus]|uniref:aminotransferase class I/II-fold pyridoxal phosphate-dependent enzyme n=1 Tax=Pedobacter glucosidilyticus TaxID=1122941 RepID=UPI0003F906F8|nr:pyridoxal phosphate-dependent aminotransferase family protein [Pedobacter glucosidilyticus]